MRNNKILPTPCGDLPIRPYVAPATTFDKVAGSLWEDPKGWRGSITIVCPVECLDDLKRDVGSRKEVGFVPYSVKLSDGFWQITGRYLQ